MIVFSPLDEFQGQEAFDLSLIRASLEGRPSDSKVDVARSGLAIRNGAPHGSPQLRALAKTSGEPLLAKGTEFKLTDIEACSVKQE